MHEALAPPDEELSFSVELRTRWSDEDNQSVLNNAVYLTLFEEGRLAYFESLGLIEEARFPFLLAETTLRFSRPGRGGCEVRLAMGTVRLGTSSFEQAYRLRGPGGEVWCEGRARLVCYDAETACSRPMTEAFRARVMGREGLGGGAS